MAWSGLGRPFSLAARSPQAGVQPEIEIKNVVLMAELPHRLDLEVIRDVFLEAEPLFPHRPGAGLIIRLRKSRASVNVFGSGKMVCAGARSVRSAKSVINKVIRTLRRSGVVVDRPVRTEVVNIVATADLHGSIDLEQAAYALAGRAMYDPEQFSGLVYHPDGSSLKLLVFHNGKVICAGAKSVKEAREAVLELAEELWQRGLIVDGEELAEEERPAPARRDQFRRSWAPTGAKLVSVPLPERYLEGLEELVRLGRYPNRSEAIRVAVRDLLLRELWSRRANS